MRWGMKSACYRPITSGAPRSGWISTRGREYNHAQRNTSFLFTRCWWMEPCENLSQPATHHSLLKSNLLFDWNLRFDIIYFYVLIVKNFVLLFACAFALSFQLSIIIVMAFECFVLLILWTLDVAQFCRKTIYLGVLLLLQAPQ